MIHIGICDDDIVEGKAIEHLVEHCCRKSGTVCRRNIFSDSKSMLYEIQDGCYFDLLLLDIEMPNMNGINLTGEIRKHLPDVLIIFVSSHEKYVYESFQVQPYRFIPKRALVEMLPSAVEDALSLIAEQDGKFYVIENHQRLEKILVKHIEYIWHRGKYAYLEKADRSTVKIRKTLKQVYEELPKEDFVWADRGCILNLAKISGITGENVILISGRPVPVSRDRLTELKNHIREYWLERDGLKD